VKTLDEMYIKINDVLHFRCVDVGPDADKSSSDQLQNRAVGSEPSDLLEQPPKLQRHLDPRVARKVCLT